LRTGRQKERHSPNTQPLLLLLLLLLLLTSFSLCVYYTTY
jgi:hypothetical protein